MTDFSKPFRGVQYFGIWATETADDYGRRDAIAILVNAVERCGDEDMREDGDTRAALAYLTREGHEKRATAFRQALDIKDRPQRQHQAHQAIKALIDRQRPLPKE